MSSQSQKSKSERINDIYAELKKLRDEITSVACDFTLEDKHESATCMWKADSVGRELMQHLSDAKK